MIELDPYQAYVFYYGKMTLFEETSTEVGYDENGNELPFQSIGGE